MATRFEQHPGDLAAPVRNHAPVQLDGPLEGGDRLVVLAGRGEREANRLEHVRHFPVGCLRIADTPLGDLASLIVPAFPQRDTKNRLLIRHLGPAWIQLEVHRRANASRRAARGRIAARIFRKLLVVSVSAGHHGIDDLVTIAGSV